MTVGKGDAALGARVSNSARSLLMARVRRSGTAPEMSLRRALHRAGLRYRLATGNPLPGTPDLAFRRSRVAVFVDGCFWHGCPQHGSLPKTNTDFWDAKIRRNRRRDQDVDRELRHLGWKVVRVWEHDLRAETGPIVRRIRLLVRSRGVAPNSSHLEEQPTKHLCPTLKVPAEFSFTESSQRTPRT